VNKKQKKLKSQWKVRRNEEIKEVVKAGKPDKDWRGASGTVYGFIYDG